MRHGHSPKVVMPAEAHISCAPTAYVVQISAYLKGTLICKNYIPKKRSLFLVELQGRGEDAGRCWNYVFEAPKPAL
jgi:hypothetical protein